MSPSNQTKGVSVAGEYIPVYRLKIGSEMKGKGEWVKMDVIGNESGK